MSQWDILHARWYEKRFDNLWDTSKDMSFIDKPVVWAKLVKTNDVFVEKYGGS